MGERLSALARALRTFAQGLGAAVLVAGWEAAYTAVSGGTYDPRLVIMAVVTAVAGAFVTYVYNQFAPRAGLDGSPSWEGLVRAVRTLVQTAVAVAMIAAWDAVYALITAGNFNPADLGKAAVAAAVTALVAFVHNTVEAKKAATS